MTLIILVISAAVVIILLLILICLIILRKQKTSHIRVELTGGGRSADDDFSYSGGLRGLDDYPGGGTVVVGDHQSIQWYIVLEDIRTGEFYKKTLSDRLYLGRKNDRRLDNFIELPQYEYLSRTHAMMYQINGQIYLQDMKSSNHTWVNGQMIQQAVILQSGDIIKLANAELRFSVQRL